MDAKIEEQKRENYSRLVLDKERNLDELKNEQKKLRTIFHELQNSLNKGYRELSMLNEEALYHGSSDGLAKQRQIEEQERKFQHQLRISEEQLLEDYQVEIRNCNDEIDKLYEKRRSVSWD